jgi:hypothetical protein
MSWSIVMLAALNAPLGLLSKLSRRRASWQFIWSGWYGASQGALIETLAGVLFLYEQKWSSAVTFWQTWPATGWLKQISCVRLTLYSYEERESSSENWNPPYENPAAWRRIKVEKSTPVQMPSWQREVIIAARAAESDFE